MEIPSVIASPKGVAISSEIGPWQKGFLVNSEKYKRKKPNLSVELFLLAEDEGFDVIKVLPPSRPAASDSPPDCRILNRSNPPTRIKQNSPSFRMSCFILAEDEGFDLINVALRQAVARNSPPDCCI